MFEATEKQKIIIPDSLYTEDVPTLNKLYRPRSRKINFIVPDRSFENRRTKYRRITHSKCPYYHGGRPAPPDLWTQDETDDLTRRQRCDFSRYAHFLRSLNRYQLQPVEIPFINPQNKRRKYKPIALLTFNREYPTATMKPALIDIRSNKNIKENWDWLYPAWRAAHRFAKTSGWNFCLIRDEFFDTPVYLNASYLLNFRRLPLNADYYTRLLDEMDLLQVTTIHQLLEKVSHDSSEYKAMMPQLMNLIDSNYLGFDCRELLTINTEIYLLEDRII